MVNALQPITFFTKTTILHILQSSEYFSTYGIDNKKKTNKLTFNKKSKIQ